MINTLLVEDDITFAQLIQGFLKKNDYQVTHSFSIKEAIHNLKNNPYQIILLDFNLPNLGRKAKILGKHNSRKTHAQTDEKDQKKRMHDPV